MAHTETVVDGEKLPSVTQICGILDKPFLYRWYGTHGFEACERIKKESAERGKKLHDETENAVKKQFVTGEAVEAVSPEVEAILRWVEVTGFEPLVFERHLISKLYRYGGTYDCLGVMPKNKLAMVDWKFTGQLSDTYALQVSGYGQAHYESTGAKLDEARVVRPYELKSEAKADEIKKTVNGWRYSFKGSKIRIEERQYTNLEHYFSVFLHLREVWDYVNGKGMWEK